MVIGWPPTVISTSLNTVADVGLRSFRRVAQFEVSDNHVPPYSPLLHIGKDLDARASV